MRPVELARALAHLFLRVPPEDLTFAHLNAIAGSEWTHDPGTLTVALLPDNGEPLGPWLCITEEPGGEVAYLDVDLDALGEAMREARERGR